MKLFKKIRQASLGVSALLGSAFSVYAAGPLCNSGVGTQSSTCSVSGLATNLKAQMTSAAKIFYSGAAVIGIALVVIGLLKLKAHSMDTQGTSGHLRTAIWLLIIGALMIAIPVIMMLGANTFVGTNVNLPSEAGIFTSSAAA